MSYPWFEQCTAVYILGIHAYYHPFRTHTSSSIRRIVVEDAALRRILHSLHLTLPPIAWLVTRFVNSSLGTRTRWFTWMKKQTRNVQLFGFEQVCVGWRCFHVPRMFKPDMIWDQRVLSLLCIVWLGFAKQEQFGFGWSLAQFEQTPRTRNHSFRPLWLILLEDLGINAEILMSDRLSQDPPTFINHV